MFYGGLTVNDLIEKLQKYKKSKIIEVRSWEDGEFHVACDIKATPISVQIDTL